MFLDPKLLDRMGKARALIKTNKNIQINSIELSADFKAYDVLDDLWCNMEENGNEEFYDFLHEYYTLPYPSKRDSGTLIKIFQHDFCLNWYDSCGNLYESPPIPFDIF